jgi:glucose-6-phosphate 1-dehydrogenase
MATTEVIPAPTTTQLERTPDPCVVVIFGASGDLTKRKLLPALYHLEQSGLLPKDFAVVGVARRPLEQSFAQDMKEGIISGGGVENDDAKLGPFVNRIKYHAMNFDDAAGYDALKTMLADVDEKFGTKGNRLFYLATAPEYFSDIIKYLGDHCMARPADCGDGKNWVRVIIEKPFGHDLESAKALNQQILKVADEKQVYRIDHYLGKETVQNIMAFRFANGIFEPIWNRRYIDHVQISVAETVGVEGRGSYFDHAGSLRDMVPNHIMQLISLTAMEPPISFDANAVRDEQAKILHAIQPISDEDVLSRSVRGQYGEGVINGQHVPAYRAESDVPPDSRTETFVAMKLLIDNWRWAGVPFYLRTGKRMPARNTHIVIQFRQAPFVLFRDTSVEHLMPNQLVLHIQPEEGISLQFAAKVPGPVMRLGSVDMNFEYQQYFGKQPSTGYERLLHDCMIGDQTLFQRADMVEVGWDVVNPVLDLWKALPPRNFPNYASGTWGPKEADELLERDGRRWRNFEQ